MQSSAQTDRKIEVRTKGKHTPSTGQNKANGQI